ncbi:uncharacterized protein DUF1850 [Hoeflea marina]|uniref:Uncharacterized protein DUF1850 n=1 Tax=Hoeflea marina TaxID=274592 RepID=A0A317PCI8_9HYPH|nr:DUF1850 domain-containing protein [Hoeflea marina]PWV95379.1 uncharacterized protein DUF1850 [Hoeflea marina]
MAAALCVIAAGKMTAIALTAFTLSWTHSVEKTEWRESWAIEGDRLALTEASVKGSGAGMDPGEGAVLRDGWWVWTPRLAPVESLSLAQSGATVSAWHLCHDGACTDLGALAGDGITLRPCDP